MVVPACGAAGSWLALHSAPRPYRVWGGCRPGWRREGEAGVRAGDHVSACLAQPGALGPGPSTFPLLPAPRRLLPAADDSRPPELPASPLPHTHTPGAYGTSPLCLPHPSIWFAPCPVTTYASVSPDKVYYTSAPVAACSWPVIAGSALSPSTRPGTWPPHWMRCEPKRGASGSASKGRGGEGIPGTRCARLFSEGEVGQGVAATCLWGEGANPLGG